MNPGKSVAAEVSYEVRIQNGPVSFTLKGVKYDLRTNEDVIVLVKVVTSGQRLISEKIVGVIGDEHRSGTIEFLCLTDFMRRGGVIGLHRDLVH